MAEDLMIETRGLTKAFGSLIAVNALDLRIKQGAVHGFVGPNGAGKTTTIKMLVGAIRCTGGSGFIKGYPMGSREAKRLIGYSPERPPAYGDMTSLDYLVYLGGLSGLKPKEAEARAAGVLRSLELADFAKMKTSKFSAGMKQRLGLAQALIHDPELLLLDEPTANLDPGGRMWVIDKLRQLSQERNVTIFVSSHILPELEQLVDSVTLIDKGRLVVEGTVEDLRRKVSRNTYLLDTSDNRLVLEMIRGKPYIREVRVDDRGALHIESDDFAALQKEILPELAERGILVKTLSEEEVRLEDLYRRTIGLGGD